MLSIFDNSARLIAGPKNSHAHVALKILILLKRRTVEPINNPFADNPGGDDGTRTRDIRLAKAALSQLSYIPERTAKVVGLTGFEPVTPALSAQCSNQLSYKPYRHSALAVE